MDCFSDDETVFVMRHAPKQLVAEYDGKLEIELLPNREIQILLG